MMSLTRLLHGTLTVILAATAIAVTPSQPAAADELPWMNRALTPETRAHLLVSAMTLDQKIAQLHGQPGPIPELPECGNSGRHVLGIPELATPTFRITNGQTNPPGQFQHVAYVYYASVPIRSGVAVRAVALPVTGASPSPGMHVFAMTVD
jgi:hypothetical protein